MPCAIARLYYVPCNEPQGGWPGVGSDADTKAEELELLLRSHPDDYVGMWHGEIADNLGETIGTAKVVGTTTDAETALANLRRVYPYNLCVVKVVFSARELTDLSNRLTSENPHWHTVIDPRLDRLVVSSPVFDSALAVALNGDEDKVVLRPIVERLP